MAALHTTYLQELARSIAAVYAALEAPWIARRAVATLLIVHTGLLVYSAYVHSPTLNEPAHLAAGLSHWKFGRFELYRVNPPMVRMVAALPVIFAGYNEDWTNFYERRVRAPEAEVGEAFVAVNGRRAFFLTMIARWACIPFSWIGALICYVWARDLYSAPCGVLACAIWCFEPNILAHASLITPDAPAASLGLAASYTFWKWLKQPTWYHVVIAGLVLGIAELAKTTLLLLYPIWLVIWIVYRWPDRDTLKLRQLLREAVMLALRMFIALYVLNAGYGFENTLSPLAKYHFVSSLFTGDYPPDNGVQFGPIEPKPSNRFENTWWGKVPIPLPRNYVLGIDIQQRDFESYPRSSYLRCEWRDHGWWYYYIYACLIKVPLGLWSLAILTTLLRIFLAVVSGSCSPLGHRRLVWDEFVLLFPAAVFFVVVSSKTGFSEHLRYVLPAFPYLFIAVSQVFVLVNGSIQFACSDLTIERRNDYLYSLRRLASGIWDGGPMSTALPIAVLLFATWNATSSLWIYPHSLSYFNESIGGPSHGANHLLGSNLDWGQDLRYLQTWIEQHRDKKLHLAYFGQFDPTSVGFLDLQPEPFGCSEVSYGGKSMGTPPKSELMSGWYAINITILNGYSFKARIGNGQACFISRDTIHALERYSPHFDVGYSIRVYSVD